MRAGSKADYNSRELRDESAGIFDILSKVLRPRVGVIVGPTAVGKSELALALGALLDAELVSADSRQIYRYLDIGTAKPTAAERRRMPHHIVDVVDPDEEYSLATFQDDAYRYIETILEKGRLPLLVGGTGLYIRAVIEGLGIPRVAPQPELRAQLEQTAGREGCDALFHMLETLDPVAAARIDRQNVRRLVRALEVCLVSGVPISHLQRARPPDYRFVIIGVTCGRELLYHRIDERVDRQVQMGLVDEVRNAVDMGYGFDLPAMTGLGYRQIGEFLNGNSSLAQAVQRTKFDTHRFARQQSTWFRLDDSRINWLARDAIDWQELVMRALGLLEAREIHEAS